VAGHDVVIGRQPIFDRDLAVMGYELLFRTVGSRADPGRANHAVQAVGDLLTADVLFGSIVIGIDRLVGDKHLFCNASRGVLTGEIPIVLPPDRTVVEILESVVPDDDVLAGCRRLREEGFTLALDDFSWFEGAEPLLEMASIVKIDLRATKIADQVKLIERCRPFDVTIVAEKVETVDEFRRCQAMDFDYFQGYLLARPLAVSGRALDPNRANRLRLSARLLDAECPLSEIEEIVRCDPAMVRQLLQLASAGAAGGLRRNIRTLREALVLVGWRHLQSWVSLLLVTDKLAPARHEAITTALTRARMCELVARTFDRSLLESAFVAGLVSSFGSLLGLPLEEVLEPMSLHPDIRKAVLTGAGRLGTLIADVSDFLLGRPEAATRCGISEMALSDASLKALTWAVGATRAMEAEAQFSLAQ
jgi:c-di-GMP-related signal transduction protein